MRCHPAPLPRIVAVVVVGLYNKRPGRKLDVTQKTFGGTGVHNARTDRPSQQKSGAPAPARKALTPARKPARRNESVPALTEVASEHTGPRTVPAAVPTYASSDELADAVARLEGKPVTQIARELGIAERTVRRIQADLGIESI